MGVESHKSKVTSQEGVVYSIKPFAELTSNELYDILRLRQVVFIEEQKCIYVDCDNKDQLSDHLMGYLNGELVICCRMLPKGVSYNEYVSFGRLVNHTKIRGTGEGKKTVRMAVDFLVKKYPNEKIKISAQYYLLKYYESLGFIPEGEVYQEDLLPHIAMIYSRKPQVTSYKSI